MSKNEAAAARLEEIASLMELLGEEGFRITSTRRAARAVESFSGDVGSLTKAELLEIEGVGPKTADKVIEFCSKGTIAELEALRGKVPPGLLTVMRVPGLGPKTVRMMWQDAGVESLEGLKKIIDDGSILKLPRMGEKSVERIKAALEFVSSAGERLNIGVALPLAESVVARLREVEGVSRVEFAGSLRRGKETVGDIDVLVTVKEKGEKGYRKDAAGAASELFRALPGVKQIIVAGETKSSVRMSVGDGGGATIQVDLKVVPAASFGAALMYFTGSKEHNVLLRERAQRMGMTLNEYGIYEETGDPTPPQHRGAVALAGVTEQEVYAKLGLAWTPPELREAGIELEAKETPRLIELEDVKAELHSHTTASDGVMEIEELANRAKERGFHTIAVTDHSKGSPLAGGLTVERLLSHIEAVHRARSAVKGITILAGSEVDILADGTLDYEDDVLKKLDLVVASPHAALIQEPEAATERLVRAIRNPFVHVLGHPTGRIVQRRKGLEPDMAKVLAAAKECRVALEINANWQRLDLRDTHVRAAVKAGCLIAIDCDVHTPADFEMLRYGVVTARRGGVTPEGCVNAWSQKKLADWVRSKR
jgi:DNA polymerase (family 10)